MDVVVLKEFGKEFAKIAKAKIFKSLKRNRIPLTSEERKQVMRRGAVWHHGPNGESTPAVWKSIDPKTKKVTYITNTHRAYQSENSLKKAINKYHSFIKGTA